MIIIFKVIKTIGNIIEASGIGMATLMNGDFLEV